MLSRAALLATTMALAACAHPHPKHATADARCLHDGDCAETRARCDGGDGNACATLGWLYGTASEDAGEWHRPALGEQYLVRACTLSVFLCEGLIFVAHDREECGRDPAAAVRLLEAACDAKYPPACVDLAGRTTDVERAARLYAWACDVEDRFPPFVETNDEARPVPHRDPMRAQIPACVASETIAKLGLAPSVAPAKTTPERALELDAARRVSHRGEWQFEERHGPPAAFVARLRSDYAKTLSVPAKDRGTSASGGIALCGRLIEPR